MQKDSSVDVQLGFLGWPFENQVRKFHYVTITSNLPLKKKQHSS